MLAPLVRKVHKASKDRPGPTVATANEDRKVRLGLVVRKDRRVGKVRRASRIVLIKTALVGIGSHAPAGADVNW